MWWRVAKRFAGYSTELGILNSVLQNGYDPHDYPEQVYRHLEEDEPEDPYEHGMNWIESSDEDQLLDYKNWLEDNQPGNGDFHDPPYTAMESQGFSKPDWRVHFTDNPMEIAEQGLQYGHPDYHGVHLTTQKVDRTKEPGFNFAFPANSRSLQRSEEGRYGKHAVVFMSGALETYHHGDEESQSVVWGPHVRKDMIFPIYNRYEGWTVEDWRGRELVAGKTREEAIEYVKTNWRMLQNIRNKVQTP